MKVRDFIKELMDCDMDSEFGFVFYDTAVKDIEISCSEEDNETLIFSQRFARMEDNKE
jgi:hypothetical protein